MLFKSKN